MTTSHYPTQEEYERDLLSIGFKQVQAPADHIREFRGPAVYVNMADVFPGEDRTKRRSLFARVMRRLFGW